MTTDRRKFLAKAGVAMAAVAATSLVDAPDVIAQPKVQWRMPTTWTPANDTLQGAALLLAKIVEETSGGRFRIEVFPSGQIVQPFECFDAASKGTIEAFMAVSTYWAAKDSAFEWFHTIPFGMNPEGMAAWFHQGDGLRLWEEAYAPFNLVPRPGPAIAPQMAGWFRKKITTTSDYKGLKMRISGLGRKVITKAGATATIGNAEVVQNLMPEGGYIEVRAQLEPDRGTASGFRWSSSRGPDMPITTGLTHATRVTIEGRAPISYLLPILRERSGVY